MSRIRVTEKASGIEALDLKLEEAERPRAQPGEVVVEVRAAGVNPSDVKAALGAMPHAIWPRTPGRDWAGVVVVGPDDLIGKEVWGTGGDLGIRRDGSHARYLTLRREEVRAKPTRLTLAEAGAVGVPFVTAWEGLRRAGLPGSGDVVLVCGANGKVGQAAIQIASMRGARVFGLDRQRQPYRGHASNAVRMISAADDDVSAIVRAESGGHGADIAYNTMGSPYFAAANASLALHGRQIFISTIDRSVPFDIFAFYRGQHSFFGIDSLALDAAACATIFDELTPGFERGELKAFPIGDAQVYSLDRAADAYRAVDKGAQERIVLIP